MKHTDATISLCLPTSEGTSSISNKKWTIEYNYQLEHTEYLSNCFLESDTSFSH